MNLKATAARYLSNISKKQPESGNFFYSGVTINGYIRYLFQKAMEELLDQIASKNWVAVKKLCTERLFLNPSCPRTHAYLGLSHFYEQDYKGSIIHFQRAVALDGRFWEAGTKLAQSYDRLKMSEQAFAEAQLWLRINPNEKSLLAIVEYLQHQIKGNKTEGWERTQRSELQFIPTITDEHRR